MKLEAGKKYTDRRGRVYGPLVKTGSLFWGEDAGTPLWNNNGKIDSVSRDMDLVAEYVEPVQPEYRMLQDGETVQPDDEYCGHSEKWEKVPSSGNVFQTSLYYPHRRLVEPAAPVESPDDWVILDPVVYADHVPRVGIDQFQPSCGVWVTQERYHSKDTIGNYHRACGADTRCRRKDLPPVPPKTRTVVLKEWLCWEDAEPETVTLDWCSTSPADETDQFSAWDNAVETGNTRTVEIPVT